MVKTTDLIPSPKASSISRKIGKRSTELGMISAGMITVPAALVGMFLLKHQESTEFGGAIFGYVTSVARSKVIE